MSEESFEGCSADLAGVNTSKSSEIATAETAEPIFNPEILSQLAHRRSTRGMLGFLGYHQDQNSTRTKRASLRVSR